VYILPIVAKIVIAFLIILMAITVLSNLPWRNK